jgi:nucleoside-diphosphate-sugar epimerase
VEAVVTGVAGFIGSTLADRLIGDGWTVRGIDCFTPNYGRPMKEANLEALRRESRFTLVEADLRTGDLGVLIDGASVVFHQAAQSGVRPSWRDGFADYDSHNVLATQRLLEAARQTGTPRLVYASSSSVYGDALTYPTTEDDLPRPYSPYGVTKLAGEHLCHAYARNWSVPTVSLRYFTVYGPRQRPDMAIHRLCEAALRGVPFPLFGDGSAVRDFTFVDDVTAATLAAATADLAPGTVLNVAGGGQLTMNELVDLVSELVGRPVEIQRGAAQAGDVRRTGGRIDRAAGLLGWAPAFDVRTGLERQLAWHGSREVTATAALRRGDP